MTTETVQVAGNRRYAECRTCARPDLVLTSHGWMDGRGQTHMPPKCDVHECMFRSDDEVNEAERLRLLKETIAKNESGRWVVVPSRFGDYLLSNNSPLDIHTFKDNKDIVTYDRIWDGGLWSLKGEQEIERVATETVESCGKQIKEQLTRYMMGEMLAWIRWKTYIDRNDFKSPEGRIPLINGVYDFATGKLEAHRQENHFVYQVPVKYDAAATCPRIDKFLEEVLGDKKMLAYEIAGYALAEPTANKWQRAFMMVGPGDNGKSTFLNLVTALLGPENVSNQTLQALVENRFSVVTLDHKLANIASDIGDRSLYSTWQFKALTGGDRITAEHKFKDPYEFRSRAVLMFSCNSLPESYDDSDAFHKRWIICPFENTFMGDKKDPALLEKLTAPEELSGFFNQAIATYRDMTARSTFTGEGSTEQKREYYTRLSDPIHCFIEDCVLFDPDGMVVKQQLYAEFRAYAQKRGYGKTFTQKRFFKKFREKAGEQLYESYVKDSDGVQRRIYKGIKLETASQTSLQEATPA